MKKTIKNLSLLVSMSLLLVSCNEKISAELESGNGTTVLPPVVVPNNYFFKVTNESSPLLGYNLHKTGPGRFGTSDWECAVNSNTKFDDQIFSGEAVSVTNHDNKIYDISCFLEAQEQDLNEYGVQLAIQSSPNTCEHVSYIPFSYYAKPAGTTSASFRGYKCTGDAITDAHVNAYANAAGAVYGLVPTPIGCDQMVDMSTPVGLRVAIPISDDDQYLCKFDHLDRNCDNGSITYSLYEVYDARPTETAPVTPAIKPISRERHLCGGSPAACVDGPIRQYSKLDGQTRGELREPTVYNSAYFKEYTIDAPMNQSGDSNLYAANYRKGLANKHINFLNFDESNRGLWNDISNNRSFDPTIMENYAANQAADGMTKLIATSSLDIGAQVPFSHYETTQYLGGYAANPISAEPFVALSNGARVNPFHTFYCLDQGKEIKARIRVAIRDWDRIFPSNKAVFEYVTDSHAFGANRRMDVDNSSSEIPGDPGYYMGYNDYFDWDDQIAMTRSNVFPWAPTVLWQPTPVSAPYGFFERSYYPE